MPLVTICQRKVKAYNIGMAASNWTERLILATSGVAGIVAGSFLLIEPWELTSTQYVFAAALFIIFSAVLIQGPGTPWSIVSSVFLFGIYMLARGLGLLSYQYLRYIIGVLFFGFGFYVLMRLFTPAAKSDTAEPGTRH